MSNLAPSIQLSVAEKRAGDNVQCAERKKLLEETFISKCEENKKKQKQRKMQTVARAGQWEKTEQEGSGSHISRQSRWFVKEQKNTRLGVKAQKRPDLVTY